ncbi:MAG: sodium ion-translocating decarboxylase subunit beta, partial [Clostridiales bacterium]
MLDTLKGFYEASALSVFTWQSGVMILVSLVLFYLAIKKDFEPLLLIPIAFGMMLANIPLA